MLEHAWNTSTGRRLSQFLEPLQLDPFFNILKAKLMTDCGKLKERFESLTPTLKKSGVSVMNQFPHSDSLLLKIMKDYFFNLLSHTHSNKKKRANKRKAVLAD